MKMDLSQMNKLGMEIIKNIDFDAVHAISIDKNDELSFISAVIGTIALSSSDPIALSIVTKVAIEAAFYLGYLTGKAEGDLSLWEEQL